MITSSKVFIGLIIFYILAMILLNFYEGGEMANNTNILQSQNYTAITTNPDTSGNIVVSMVNSIIDFGEGVVYFVNKYFLFDYAFFRDLNSTPDSDGQYPFNDFVIFRWMLVAIGVVMLIQLAMSAKSMIPFFK